MVSEINHQQQFLKKMDIHERCARLIYSHRHVDKPGFLWGNRFFARGKVETGRTNSRA